jgi:hypothetical protein
METFQKIQVALWSVGINAVYGFCPPKDTNLSFYEFENLISTIKVEEKRLKSKVFNTKSTVYGPNDCRENYNVKK